MSHSTSPPGTIVPYQTRTCLIQALSDVLRPIRGRRLPKGFTADTKGHTLRMEEAFRVSTYYEHHVATKIAVSYYTDPNVLCSAYLYIVESKLMGNVGSIMDRLLDLVFSLACVARSDTWRVGAILGLHDNHIVTIDLMPATLAYLTRELMYTRDDYERMQTYVPTIGRTISSDVLITLLRTKRLPSSVAPVQTFFMARFCTHQHTAHDKDESDGGETMNTISTRQQRIDSLRVVRKLYPTLPLYVHGPLNKDACRVDADLRIAIMDLRAAVSMGAKGLIVHCGSNRLNLPLKIAIQTMMTNWRKLLVIATVDCPLLIENSAAEGTDVCCAPTTMAKLYLAFTSEERTRLGLCIDTQHAFSAGYDPLEYLTIVHDMVGPGVIRLVHYNDSSVERGAHHDHHGPVVGGWDALTKATASLPAPRRPSAARGFIGLHTMTSIAAFCVEHDIDMVTEW